MKAQIAKIYVDKTAFYVDEAFSYIIPPAFEGKIFRGIRVLVPFGKANKKVQGIVAEVCDVPQNCGQLKPVFAVLDSEPMLDEEMLGIADYLVKNTFCTYYDAVKTMLPLGVNVEIVKTYSLKKQLTDEELNSLSEKEKKLAEFLKKAKTERELNDFLDCKSNPDKVSAVKGLIEKGIIEKNDKFSPRVSKKMIKMVKLADNVDLSGFTLTKKQQSIVNMLKETKVAMLKEAAYLCGVTEAVVKNLEKKGILEFFERESSPVYKKASLEEMRLDDIVLSKEQQEVFEGVSKLIDEDMPNGALLHGVTGSGKTQVYIKLIEKVLQEGKNALLLVPEIALTPQMLQKFNSLFGGIIGVIHSSLTVAERMKEYDRIKNGEVRIVIGTRSAVFAPLPKIGLIIMDEEGEGSYKSDSSPRYHARDIAMLRLKKHNATLLLGSATPSIDSYYNAKKGRYSLFELKERFSKSGLPNVYIIDMTEEQRNKNFSPISNLLGEQLKLNLDRGEQSILLINRRGYNTVASCMECGETIKCPNCDVPMTYHKINGQMMCHYCGHTEDFSSVCPSCKGKYIKLQGVGTQKIEDELACLFPTARILRMDTDSTFSRDSYENNFEAFKNGEYDILLGTQMIAKGLDFPNVTLVGVLNADSGLNSPDFKASERIFSLITQVVGRSGRSEKSGRAYIQTRNPNDSVINYSANQDYAAFYEDEIFTRKAMNYPPFCDICLLGFNGPDREATKRAAYRAAEILKESSSETKNVAFRVLGVSEASIFKVSNKYRYRIIIKCRFNGGMKEIIKTTIKLCGRDPLFRGINIYADINGDING